MAALVQQSFNWLKANRVEKYEINVDKLSPTGVVRSQASVASTQLREEAGFLVAALSAHDSSSEIATLRQF